MSTKTAFDDAMDWLLHGFDDWHGEGGKVTARSDRAAAGTVPGTVHTNLGLTQATADDCRLAIGELPKPVADFTLEDAIECYLVLWRRSGAAALAGLPAPLAALALFDGFVQHGYDGIRLWQRVALTPADGAWGPDTLAASGKRIRELNERSVCAAYLERRYGLYVLLLQRDPTQEANRRGWRSRLNALCLRLGLAPVWP